MAERKKRADADFWTLYKRNLHRQIGDPLVSLGKGIVGACEATLGAADMATNGRAGQLVNEAVQYWSDKIGVPNLGFAPDKARQYLDTLYSPEQQRANAAVESAQGVVGTTGAMLRNPSTLAHSALEAAPVVASTIIGGGGAAKLAGRAATPLAHGAARIAGASTAEGLYGAAQEAQRIQREGVPVWDRPGDVVTRGAMDSAIGLSGRLVAPVAYAADNVVTRRPIAAGIGEIVNNGIRGEAIGSNLGRGVRGLAGEGVPESMLQNMVGGFMPETRAAAQAEKKRKDKERNNVAIR